MASTARGYALTDRYHRARATIAQRNGVFVARAWDDQDGLDDITAERFAQMAARSDIVAKRQATTLTDAYHAAYLSAELGRRVRPKGLDPDQFVEVRGAGQQEVWLRSMVTARAAVTRGRDYLDARREGRARAVATARTNIALVSRVASREILARIEEVTGYRRVTSGKTCALCASAAARIYRKSDLLPIHSSCDCSVEAVVVGRKEIPRPTPEVRDEPGVTEMVERGQPVVKVVQHNELGPMLWQADHDFAAMS